MKVSVIIGAGQLGSRHLQGLLKSKIKQTIIVYDLSKSSLFNANERANEVKHSHKLIFTDQWYEIPKLLDLVIISTSSNVRYKILKNLLSKNLVKNVVLEKVLYQSEREYDLTEMLCKKYTTTNFWVNHPRRMSVFYKTLKSKLIKSNSVVKKISISGIDWGLACNSLHFVDLITYLTGDNIKSIYTDFLEKKTIKSKREGFIEFNGTLIGNFSNGAFISLTSYTSAFETKNKEKLNHIYIETDKENILITEGLISNVIYKNISSNSTSNSEFNLKLQSELTTELANKLFKTGFCNLPRLDVAIINHKIFIRSLLKFYNKINNSNKINLPIT